jgi:uncharacterized protein YggU (UPF0235/DUF167 family)
MDIRVKVKTNAKIDSVIEKSKALFFVSVREKPERNLANKKIVELIAKHFLVPVSSVRVVSGHHRSSKILSLRGIVE